MSRRALFLSFSLFRFILLFLALRSPSFGRPFCALIGQLGARQVECDLWKDRLKNECEYECECVLPSMIYCVYVCVCVFGGQR